MRRKLFNAILLSVLVLPSCKSSENKDIAQARYQAIRIDTCSVSINSAYPASIRGRQDIAIYPQVSGRIAKVCISEGQKVKKGESLFVIDQVPFKAALQMAQANVESAKAAVATAELDYKSKEMLYQEKVISEFELQTGIIMLIGLLSKTAILITEYASKRRKAGMSIHQAAVGAAKARLRPILMTALTMIFGMLPLMFASGVGANGNSSLGTGAVGGMLVGTLVLIFLVPSLFCIFQSLQERIHPVQYENPDWHIQNEMEEVKELKNSKK